MKMAEMTHTENGALTNATTNSVIVDQFGKAGNYRDRSIDEVFHDQELLWNENPQNALRFPFYLRLITRVDKINDENTTDKVQKGQGVKDESFKRLLWLAEKHKDVFVKNIWLLPIVGSWKDLWTLMYYDITYGCNAIDHAVIFEIIIQGLKSETHVNLVKKFMPRIRSVHKCHTPWAEITNALAREFAKYNHWSYREYNHEKATGTAHNFQKVICARQYQDINWNRIPGRALFKLTNGKFLRNHDLEDNFGEWLSKQPTAKFTGYVYELVHNVMQNLNNFTMNSVNLNVPAYKKELWNKQFNELISKARHDGKIKGNVWCALDTSGSMAQKVVPNVTAYDICISLGIFFSELNTGAFHNNVIMFDNESRVKTLNGTFIDKIISIVSDQTAWGGTNFQSVVDEICNIRKNNPNIPLEDYPQTLLVVSDMQFNPTTRYGHQTTEEEERTNYEEAKRKLMAFFPKEWVDGFRFIWWDCTSRAKRDFPATIDDGGCYFFSGFDGSIIDILCGEEAELKRQVEKRSISMQEVIQNALSQEILSYLKI